MCGIAGIALAHGPVAPRRIWEMAGALHHRGPDDTGVHLEPSLALGHTRLSIIDLAGGHQPLQADNGALVLIANGEIYNYVELRAELEARGRRFATHSDCETILHLYAEYGDTFLSRLHGMFAFALYDRKRDRLLLARDRLGMKPLFLARQPQGVAFASELKALLPVLADGPAIDPIGLMQYLQFQFSTGATTILRGVERVLPGEAVWIERGQIVRRGRYWSPLDVRPVEIGYDEAEQRFDALMEQVMREHMRSDVPFGLFLSGGVDSGVLLALLSRLGAGRIRTYSVGFADTRLVDELPLASAVARRFDSDHVEIRPTRQDILHSLPYTTWAADELMRDYASLPTALLAETAGRALKVVFSGEGGDEVFAGYGRYRASRLERWVKSLLWPGTGGFRVRGTFDPVWARRLFTPALAAGASAARMPHRTVWRSTPSSWSDLQRMQYVDLVTALPDNLMVKADRLLMGHGLEGRLPFLDHRIVEFGLSLPDRLKVENGQGKSFVKRWALRYLPREHLYARKRGFHVPVGEWLAEELPRLRTALPGHPAIAEWFRPAGVEALLKSYRVGGSISRMVYALLQFAVWYEIFVHGKAERPPARLDPIALIAR